MGPPRRAVLGRLVNFLSPFALKWLAIVLFVGGVGLVGWAMAERVEVYRLRAENTDIENQRKEAADAAERNFKASAAWQKVAEDTAAAAAALKTASDAAIERVDELEDAATDAARTAEREVTVYVQDISRIRMPCGLVRLLDAAADDSASAGTDRRKAELSAAAGCAGKGDADLSRLGWDRLVSGFLWLAEDRRLAKARAAGMSRWFAEQWGPK